MAGVPHEGSAPHLSPQQRCSNLQQWSGALAAGCRRQWCSLSRRLKVTGGIIRQHPSTLAAPVVMLAVMLAVGCWGVTWGADKQAQQAKHQAASFAQAFMSNYRNDVQQIGTPLLGLAAGIRQHPSSFEYLNTSVLPTLVPDTLALMKSNIFALSISPQGKVLANFLVPTIPLGIDSLHPDFPDRPTIVSSITARGLTISGPYHGVPAVLLENVVGLTPEQRDYALNDWLIAAFIPIYVRPYAQNTSATLPLDVPPPINCTECNEVVNGEVFWGFVGSSMFVGQYLNKATFHDARYRFSLSVPQARNGFVNAPPSVVGRSDRDVVDPVSASVVVDATGFTWTLYVSPESGTWRPAWEVPLMVTVVIASVALAAMQFLALLAWRQHQMLLTSLLPRAVIQRLQQQHDYTSGAVAEESLVASGTPAETMLRILTATMQGDPPDMRDAMLVRTTLLRGADVYRPLDLGVKLKASRLDSDVARALARQLDSNDAFLTTAASGNDEVSSHLGSSFTVAKRDASILDCADAQYDNLQSALSALVTGNEGNMEGRRPGVTGQTMDSPTGASDFTERPIAPPAGGVCMTGTARDPAMLLSAPPLLALHNGTSCDVMATVPHSRQEHDAYSSKVDTVREECTVVASVPRQLQVEQVEQQLESASKWAFDAMELAACTNGHALSTLGFFVLTKTGLMTTFKLRGAKVARFLRHVESLYLDNPYHSATHAADVLQTMHVLLQRGGLAGQYADPLGQLACYFAAVVHDLGHLGCTNDFLVATSHNLAVLYNDKAPQENHHVSQAFELLRQPEMDFLAPLTREQRARLRRMVIELVLATDMKQHFQVVSQFKTLHQAQMNRNHNRAESVRETPRAPRRSLFGDSQNQRQQTDECSAGQQPLQSPTAPAMEPVDEAGKLLTLQFALKCADLGHLASPLSVHVRWVASLEEEFFRQGDAERAAGLCPSPLCDRSKPGITKSQVGFFSIVVLPQFQALAAAMPAMQPLCDAINANYRHWQGLEKLQAASASACSSRATGS